MERKNGGGQDARATVVRASCPEPSIANQSANRTVLGGPPVIQIPNPPQARIESSQ